MKRKNQTRGDAFTLTELIVVVGTVALLAGILLPAYATSGRKAGIVECKNNLRQVGTAIAAYSSDNINSLPGPLWLACYPTYKGGTSPSLYFMGYYLAPYLGLPVPDGTLRRVPALDCPASVQAQRNASMQGRGGATDIPVSYIPCSGIINNPGQYINRPFGYPSSPGPATPPMKTTDFRRPSDQGAITDVDAKNGAVGAMYSQYIPASPVHNNRAGGPRQMARRNYLYFDWSVRSVETPW